MIKLLLVFGLFVILKLVRNLYKLWRISKLKVAYHKYLEATAKEKNKEEQWAFFEKKQEIIDLFKDAKLANEHIRFMQPAGYGYLAPSTLSVFDNITSINAEIIPRVISYFYEAIGAYKRRAIDSINLFYWFDVFIFLPQKIIEHFDLNKDSKVITIVVKILDILYWLLIAIATIMNYYLNLGI